MQFTAKDVLNTVIRIGKENPDFVYTKQEGSSPGDLCGYAGKKVGSLEGSPCIVGKALIEYGVDPEDLQYSSASADELVPGFTIGGDLDEASLEKIRRIQVRQDRGIPWGKAINV